jgi:hypothetical protein
MCDFFWLSPADQGDLSDVVRASLQQQQPPLLPPVVPPPTTVRSHGSLVSQHLPEEEEELLVRGNNNGVMGLLVGTNDDAGCDRALYPHHYQQPEADHQGLLIPQQLMSSSSFVEPREDDVADAPVLDELGVMDMAMAAHADHSPSIKRRFESQVHFHDCMHMHPYI